MNVGIISFSVGFLCNWGWISLHTYTSLCILSSLHCLLFSFPFFLLCCSLGSHFLKPRRLLYVVHFHGAYLGVIRRCKKGNREGLDWDVADHHSVHKMLKWLSGKEDRLRLRLSPHVCSDLCPLSQRCYLTTSSYATLFSFFSQSFPEPGSFPMNQLFSPGSQCIGASDSASV